jgi:DNA-binding transcriptional ArsR family regulator
MPDTTPTPAPATLTYEQLAEILTNAVRWQILADLSAGGHHMVLEIAERTGLTPALVSQHLRPLRRHGIVLPNRAGLHAIAPAWLTAPGEITIGPCVLRFKKTA